LLAARLAGILHKIEGFILEFAQELWEISDILICVHILAHFVLKMIKHTLYVAAEEMAPQSGRLVSLAAVCPSGEWFYAEVTDIEGEECSQFVRDCVLPQLRKVTETTFVKSGGLGAALARWIERWAASDDGEIEIRTQDAEVLDVPLLRELLRGHTELGGRLRAGQCSVDRVTLERGLARCGGPSKVGGSAIIRAVLAAVCDESRQAPIGALGTRRFELLMGTRNATSLRAWIRRHEQQRQLAAAMRAGADAQAIDASRAFGPLASAAV